MVSSFVCIAIIVRLVVKINWIKHFKQDHKDEFEDMVLSICALDNEMQKIKDTDDVVIILFEGIEETSYGG